MSQKYQPKSIGELKQEWATDPRWQGIQRSYTAEDVDRLRGTFQHDHTIARMGSERLWELLHHERLNPCPRRPHRQPGSGDGAGRPSGYLSERLAGGG